MVDELAAAQVRNLCDPDSLGFENTGELEPREGIIGQSRALQALQFGLEMPGSGYNIYVAGVAGTGRTTAVKAYLEDRALHQEVPSDWCYVNNFADPYRPKSLRLPAGRGAELQRDVKAFVERAHTDIHQAFESDEYRDRKEAVQVELEREQQALFKPMKERSEEAGFSLEITQMGMAFVPLEDGKPIDQKAFLALDAEARKEMERRRDELQEEMKDTLTEMRSIAKNLVERVQELDRGVALYVVELLMEDLVASYSKLPEVSAYLQSLQDDILENIDAFRSNGDQGEGAPVVMELNPTYSDLFGRIEKESQFGALHTDFTLVRGGSIHRANGGYLVLPVEELLRNIFVWDGLKRSLRNNKIEIEELGERLGYITTRGLRPEPIPLQVKVVLIGNPMLYHLLHQWDSDFTELFKIKADFDTRMKRTDANIQFYLASISRMCKAEDHRCLDNTAAAKLIEHSSRLADDQERLSTHFGDMADLIRESDFWAASEGADFISASHVSKAIDKKIYRSNMIQERVQEMIERGTLLIDTQGSVVGRLNGLSVISLGDYAFGRPNRITASIGLGRGGIVDIEREAKLGGPLHTKGVLILSGYLVQKYAQDKALPLSARLVFEQSYGGVEGDSASSAELYALLSALSGLPIRQSIAVTGSVNQQGDVQAIGGVNEKVEGFFEVCRALGDLSGEQGVMIPFSNVQNLMLKEEVVQAIAAGQFHVWPVRSIDEGIECLTGVAAGERDAADRYPEGSVHGLVDQRLCALAECLKEGENDDRKEEN